MDSENVWDAENKSMEAYSVRREVILRPHDLGLLLRYHQLRQEEYQFLVARYLEEDGENIEPTRSQETQTEPNPWVADEVSSDDCIDLTSEGTPSEADTIILSTDDEDTDDDEAEKENTATGGDKLPRQDTGDSSSSDWYKYPESSDDEDAMSRFAQEIADLCEKMWSRIIRWRRKYG